MVKEDKSEIFVTAELSKNGRIMTVHCPFCGKTHRHGTRGEGKNLKFPTHRLSHCESPDLNGNGYTITGFTEECFFKNLDWDAAYAHFVEVRKQYQELAGVPGVNTCFALQYVFLPIARRYASGERTHLLYRYMTEIE